MQFNFFSFVREGIKHSILLGVSDAVEAIGTPGDTDELNQRLSEALQPAIGAATSGGRTTKRKRLGRTLKEIEKDQD